MNARGGVSEASSGEAGIRPAGRVLLEEVEVLQGDAGAERHTVERVSATWHGTPVTWVSSLSMLRSSDPPPDMTMPLSMIVARKLRRGLFEDEADGADESAGGAAPWPP